MANSKRFFQLEKRLASIKTLYFPELNPQGNYTIKEQDDLRAFLFFIHAEIESFFEDIAEDKVKKAFNDWKSNRKKSNVLLSLTSFHTPKEKNNCIETRINDSLSHFINFLNKNNGIKEENILKILLPIGVEISEIDNTWLSSLNSFGEKRGEIAHKSIKVQQPLDPKTIKESIDKIMDEIKILDEKIKKIS